MRTWQVTGKYPVYDGDATVTHTDISIASTSGGYATYTERVLGNHTAKTDAELIELAREAHFKSEYADRAMAESVQKIDEMQLAIKEGQRLRKEMQEQLEFSGTKMAQIDGALERSEEQFKKVEEFVKIMTGTINELIANMMGESEDEETVE